MQYFNGKCYSGSVYHGDWKYALQEYGKGMDTNCPRSQREEYLKKALQVLDMVPDSTSYDGVTSSDVKERKKAIEYIQNVLYDL